MKKLLLTILCLLLGVSSALALTGIANTPHNFTATQPDNTLYFAYSSNTEDELCVFCHTPHGGSLDAPLWNRDTSSLSGASHYTHYTSDTVSSVISGSTTRAVNGPSLACLSCHDGSIAIGDSLLNLSQSDPNVPGKIQAIYNADLNLTVPGARIGGRIGDSTSSIDLSDDHPISFSYTAVDALKDAEFQDVGYVTTTQGLQLYTTNNNVECGTCHDPHVDYLADTTLDPFLRISNDGSAMCLSCHIK